MYPSDRLLGRMRHCAMRWAIFAPSSALPSVCLCVLGFLFVPRFYFFWFRTLISCFLYSSSSWFSSVTSFFRCVLPSLISIFFSFFVVVHILMYFYHIHTDYLSSFSLTFSFFIIFFCYGLIATRHPDVVGPLMDADLRIPTTIDAASASRTLTCQADNLGQTHHLRPPHRLPTSMPPTSSPSIIQAHTNHPQK